MDEATSKAERIRASRGNKWSRPESRPKSAGCSRDEKMDEATSKAERIRASRGNKWSRPESRPKSAGCSRDEKMDEATSKAERIRASRGNYEAEVTCTGEKGLHESLIWCKKNPNHKKFIPVKNFNIEHLPSRYHDNLLVDYVRATSDLTCRLLVSCISKDRPETWPDSDQAFPFSPYKGENSTTVGTGWVSRVFKYTEKDNINCPCTECCTPGTHTPKKTWASVYIDTACHVIYGNEEARHTKCQFFYDSPETDINTVPTLTGLKVLHSDIKGDKCEMWCYTHDVELLDKLYKMSRRWEDLRYKVINKYVYNISPGLSSPGVGCDTNVDHDLCIVVSHPHGCTKVVSVGTWTHRNVVDNYGSIEDITYRYNTPTCPGSSGAGVFTLCKDGYMEPGLFNHLPAHSQGRPGNDNNSGKGVEDLTNL